MPRSYEGEYSNDSKNSEAITLLRKQLELQDQQIAKLLEAVNKKTCTAISPIKSMAEAGKIEELADSDKQEDDEDEPHDVKKVKKKGTEIRTVKKKQVIETDEEEESEHEAQVAKNMKNKRKKMTIVKNKELADTEELEDSEDEPQHVKKIKNKRKKKQDISLQTLQSLPSSSKREEKKMKEKKKKKMTV